MSAPVVSTPRQDEPRLGPLFRGNCSTGEVVPMKNPVMTRRTGVSVRGRFDTRLFVFSHSQVLRRQHLQERLTPLVDPHHKETRETRRSRGAPCPSVCPRSTSEAILPVSKYLCESLLLISLDYRESGDGKCHREQRPSETVTRLMKLEGRKTLCPTQNPTAPRSLHC